MNKLSLIALLSLAVISCKPYKKPDIRVIDTNESAYLLDLVNSGEQAKYDSFSSLEEKKIASKEIEIDQRWVKTGRMWMSGEWRPNQRLVLIRRTPVDRTFATKGDGTNITKDDAIWVESRDSVGFSVGWSITAKIKEEDTSLFLYEYPSGPSDPDAQDFYGPDNPVLVNIMDREVRSRIQARSSEFAALAPMDTLREFKAEMLSYVRDGLANMLVMAPEKGLDDDGNPIFVMREIGNVEDGVVPYFANKGITVTNLGIFGGFTYENKSVQEAIDKVFEAQQEKNVAAAEYDAQLKRNDTIKLTAEAAAEKERTEAQGKADGIKSIIMAEVEALEAAQANPLYVQRLRLEKWDGRYPNFFMGGSGESGLDMLLQMPQEAMVLPTKGSVTAAADGGAGPLPQ